MQIFGVTLEKAAQRMGIESTKTKYVGKVPAPIFTCCTWVNKYALKVEGLHRIPGDHGKISGQKAVWNLGAEVNFHPPPQDSPSTVCSMLKLFLRELQGSLFTEKLHAKFIAAARKTDGESDSSGVVARLKALLPKLPPCHSASLEILFHHLFLVQSFKAENLMSAENLCTCIFPMTDYRDVAVIMIVEFPRLFDRDMEAELKERENSVPSEDNQPFWKQLVEK